MTKNRYLKQYNIWMVMNANNVIKDEMTRDTLNEIFRYSDGHR